MAHIKPPVLVDGDTVTVLSGSSSLATLFPHRIERGISEIERLGFKVKRSLSLSRSWKGSAGTPSERAADIHEAFSDPQIKAIICAIGGITANQVLPLLDYDLIRSNPKIFIGYSDNSLFHYAFASQSQLVSFYGPCVMTDFAEFPNMDPYTQNYFLKGVSSRLPIGTIERSPEWTDEFLDWMAKEDLKQPRKKQINEDGHVWLQRGSVSAPIVGGCLPSIMQLRGTKYDINYRGKILFIETPEGEQIGRGLSLGSVEKLLIDLKLGEVFQEISGLIIGRPYGYTENERSEFRDLIEHYVCNLKIPVLLNANIGHTSPIITIPLMVKATLDSANDSFLIIESGVQ